jgi:hypothetical protein
MGARVAPTAPPYLSGTAGLYVVTIGRLTKIGRSAEMRGRLKAHLHDGLTGGFAFRIWSPPTRVERLYMSRWSIPGLHDMQEAERFALALAVRTHGEPVRGREYFADLDLEDGARVVRTAMRAHGWPEIETEELDMPKLVENLRTPRPMFRMVAS